MKANMEGSFGVCSLPPVAESASLTGHGDHVKSPANTATGIPVSTSQGNHKKASMLRGKFQAAAKRVISDRRFPDGTAERTTEFRTGNDVTQVEDRRMPKNVKPTKGKLATLVSRAILEQRRENADKPEKPIPEEPTPEVIGTLPLMPRFGATLSREATVALLMGYEDVLQTNLASKFPEVTKERSTTPVPPSSDAASFADGDAVVNSAQSAASTADPERESSPQRGKGKAIFKRRLSYRLEMAMDLLDDSKLEEGAVVTSPRKQTGGADAPTTPSSDAYNTWRKSWRRDYERD